MKIAGSPFYQIYDFLLGGIFFLKKTSSTHLYKLFQVFLILWWWMGMLGIIASLRLVYRLVQMKSAWIRYELLNMRMNRYFRKSKRITKIEIFIRQCKLGDWWVRINIKQSIYRSFLIGKFNYFFLSPSLNL